MANVIEIITTSRNMASAGLNQTTRSVEGLNKALLLVPPSARMAFRQVDGLATVMPQLSTAGLAAGVAVGVFALSLAGLARMAETATRETIKLAKQVDELAKKKLISAEEAAVLRDLNLEMKELSKILLEMKIDALMRVAPAVEAGAEAVNKILNRLRLVPSLIAVAIEAVKLWWQAWDIRTLVKGPAGFEKLLDLVHELVAAAKDIKLDEKMAEVAEQTKKALVNFQELSRSILLSPAGLSPDLRRPGAPLPGISSPIQNIPPPMASENVEVLAGWHQTVEEITASATVLDETLGALFSGLNAGFSQVFQGLLDKTQTFASAMKALFRALVNAVLAELARIAAAKLFGFILRILGVPVGGGAAAEAVTGGGGPGMGSPGFVYPTASAGPSVTINAIDERSFAEHFRSFSGSGLRAERRRAEAGEW